MRKWQFDFLLELTTEVTVAVDAQSRLHHFSQLLFILLKLVLSGQLWQQYKWHLQTLQNDFLF